MKRPIFFTLLINLFILSMLPGCDKTSSANEPPGRVTFTIPISAEIFSKKGDLRVRLWDADQLDIMAKTANCAVSFDLETQTEEVHCPEGVEYEQVMPEEFSFPLQEIGASIEVKSSKIRVGERYRLLISGLSNDDCNTTSATVESVAQTDSITLKDLMWATTLMACP
jgi:hypothetical protein